MPRACMARAPTNLRGSNISSANTVKPKQTSRHKGEVDVMKSILIVEDDRLVADVYSRKLRDEGFLVDVAADGKAGLEMFRNRKVDLMLLDLLLPEIDGVEVLKQVRTTCSPR